MYPADLPNRAIRVSPLLKSRTTLLLHEPGERRRDQIRQARYVQHFQLVRTIQGACYGVLQSLRLRERSASHEVAGLTRAI